MATLYGKSAGGNWSAAGTWSTTGSAGVDNSGPPTAADNVILESGTGNITIDSAAVCRGIDTTSGTGSYTGTLTHNASVSLTIGDATAAAGNVALKFNSGMTYTLVSVNTATISFVSTSATVQTIDFGGKSCGPTTWNASSNGSWRLTSAFTCASTNTVCALTKGTLDFNGQSFSAYAFDSNNTNTRALTLGASTITITGGGLTAWNIGSSGMTLSAASSTLTMNGATATFSPGNGTPTYGTVNMTGSGQAQINLTFTCTNFTRTGTASKTDNLNVGANFTCTGAFTLNSNSAINRLIVQSSSLGVTRTITAASVVVTNIVDFQDMTGAGAATWTVAGTGATALGDCGGNSGITFSTSSTQTWSGTSGGNWSANAWTTRVPLPQDDVVINAAFSASQTVTADMPRLARSITWTGATGSPTFANSINTSIYGSLTYINGMSFSSTAIMSFAGRGSFTITSAGKSTPWGITIVAPTGTYTLNDAISSSSGTALTLLNGGFNANGFNVSFASFAGSGTLTRSLTMGSGTWTLNGIGAWTLTTTTGLTFSGASSTINLTGASASARTFAGGSLTYGTLTYTVAGSTGKLTVTGSNTFSNINFSDASNARTLEFTNGTTTTITGSFNVNGTSGKLMSVVSTTGGSAFTLTKTGAAVRCDYLSIQDSTATGGAQWIAGTNSTNVSGNTGWVWYQALNFGGDTSYVAAGTADPTAGSFTIGMWMNWGGSPNTANTSQALISKHTSFGTQRWWFGLDKTNSYKFLVYGDGGAFPFWALAPTSGTLTHVVWVHDSGVNEKLYINGAFHSNISSITLGASTASPIIIGASTNGTAERYKGVLDGVFINTTALSAGNIASIYAGTDPNTLTGAWATWHMDEGRGTSTADSTGSNTGTLSGATLPTWTAGIEAIASSFTPRGMLLGIG